MWSAVGVGDGGYESGVVGKGSESSDVYVVSEGGW